MSDCDFDVEFEGQQGSQLAFKVKIDCDGTSFGRFDYEVEITQISGEVITKQATLSWGGEHETSFELIDESHLNLDDAVKLVKIDAKSADCFPLKDVPQKLLGFKKNSPPPQYTFNKNTPPRMRSGIMPQTIVSDYPELLRSDIEQLSFVQHEPPGQLEAGKTNRVIRTITYNITHYFAWEIAGPFHHYNTEIEYDTTTIDSYEKSDKTTTLQKLGISVSGGWGDFIKGSTSIDISRTEEILEDWKHSNSVTVKVKYAANTSYVSWALREHLIAEKVIYDVIDDGAGHIIGGNGPTPSTAAIDSLLALYDDGCADSELSPNV